jgi:RimJ/RimL family protein N-acetyltransferase
LKPSGPWFSHVWLILCAYDPEVTIVLREMTPEAADAILKGERPGGLHVAEDYPTEFSAGVAQCVGTDAQFGPFLVHRSEDDVVIGEIGGAFIEEGTIEIGYAVVESQWNRGYASAAVEALVTKARDASDVHRIVAHTPIERPQSGRVLAKVGFAMGRQTDDLDQQGDIVRVTEWELPV